MVPVIRKVPGASVKSMFACLSLTGFKELIGKIDDTSWHGKLIDGRPGWLHAAVTAVTLEKDDVADLVLRQDNAPITYKTQRQISRQTGISLPSFSRIMETYCLKLTVNDSRCMKSVLHAIQTAWGEVPRKNLEIPTPIPRKNIIVVIPM